MVETKFYRRLLLGRKLPRINKASEFLVEINHLLLKLTFECKWISLALMLLRSDQLSDQSVLAYILPIRSITTLTLIRLTFCRQYNTTLLRVGIGVSCFRLGFWMARIPALGRARWDELDFSAFIRLWWACLWSDPFSALFWSTLSAWR